MSLSKYEQVVVQDHSDLRAASASVCAAILANTKVVFQLKDGAPKEGHPNADR